MVTIPSVVGILLVSALAAFAFARFKFRGSNLLFYFILIGIMVPPQAIVIPAFQLVAGLGLDQQFCGSVLHLPQLVPGGHFHLARVLQVTPRGPL